MNKTAKIACILGLALTACLLRAQDPDPNTRMLIAHAKADRDLFSAGSVNGFSFGDYVRKNNAGLTMLRIEDRMISAEESDPGLLGTRLGAELFIARSLKYADAVVMGRIVRQLCILNSHKSSIVTDGLMQVDEVLHAGQGTEVHAGGVLVVTRPGGTFHIDGHRVETKIEEMPMFATGSTYLMFLRLNVETGSYIVETGNAFLIDGERFRSPGLKRIHPAASLISNAEEFLETVRRMAAELDSRGISSNFVAPQAIETRPESAARSHQD